MDNEKDEQVVFVKDLLFAVLYRWRGILIAAVVLAGILGGGKVLSAWKTAGDPEVLEALQEKNQAAMAHYETTKAALEREIRRLGESIESQKAYLENSVRMNLDPYALCTASASLYVDTEYQILPGMDYQNPDTIRPILLAYQAKLVSNPVMEAVAEDVGLDAKYLRELVSVEISDSFGMTVSAVYSDEAGAKQILDLLVRQAEDAEAAIAGAIGEHTVTAVTTSVDQAVDLKLASAQKAENDRLNEMLTRLDKATTEAEVLEEPELAEASRKSAVKTGIKFAVVGGVLGAFLVAGCACISGFSSDRVYSARMLNLRCDVKILGRVALPCKCGIDRWLRKLEGRTPEGNGGYALAAANVKNRTEGVRKLLITGDAGIEAAERVAGTLRSALAGTEVLACGSLLRDPEALAVLPGCDAVVLAEVCGQSRYSSVSQALELAGDLNKPVLGCVVAE